MLTKSAVYFRKYTRRRGSYLSILAHDYNIIPGCFLLYTYPVETSPLPALLSTVPGTRRRLLLAAAPLAGQEPRHIEVPHGAATGLRTGHEVVHRVLLGLLFELGARLGVHCWKEEEKGDTVSNNSYGTREARARDGIEWSEDVRGKRTIRDKLGHADEEGQTDQTHEDHGVLEDAKDIDYGWVREQFSFWSLGITCEEERERDGKGGRWDDSHEPRSV